MIIRGDSRHLPLLDSSVDCVVTSPPYYGLRDYGMPEQIGLEASPDDYVATLVGVFRELRRVLKDCGTCWLNLGDSYNAAPVGSFNGGGFKDASARSGGRDLSGVVTSGSANKLAASGLPPKNLMGIPWRVAFALQADGWYLRSDIVWSKPNPMPESVGDRPTKSHEYVFLLAKGQSRVRSVSFANLNPEFVYFGLNFGKQAAGTDVVKVCVSLASAFFYGAQFEDDFSLPPFYSEVWTERAKNARCDLVASLPAIHRLAAHAACFLNANTSTKEFLCEVQRVWSDLRERDHFLIGRGLSECAHAPSVLVDGDTAIAINHAGQVRKIEFLHGSIVDTVTTTCNYYYDAQAIAEPVSAAMLQQMDEGYDGLGLKDYEAAGVQNPSSVKARIIANARARVTGRGNGKEGDKQPDGRQPQRSNSGGFPVTKNEQTGDRRKVGFNDRWDAKERKGDTSPRRDGNDWNSNDGRGFPFNGATRNKRTVWDIPTMPYPGAHFATMPEKLVEPCILAGCPLGGLVLDPFAGSGTVLAVAQRLGRRAVGVELAPHYLPLMQARTAQRGLIYDTEAV